MRILKIVEVAIDIIASGKFSGLSTANSRDFRHVLDFEIIEIGST